MWKSITSLLKVPPLLQANELLNQQSRTTFILRRKFPIRLHKKGREPKSLRSRNYINELVKDTTVEPHVDLEVILTSYVEGIGNAGEKVRVRQNFAYNNLLLPGLAVYASPENIKKYKDSGAANLEKVRYSSSNVTFTLDTMARMMLSVVMNKEVPWTLKPWHVRASFRKCGYIVPEEAITMPETPISGPNMDLENKEFFVTVTINKTEKVKVRCRLHHWSTELANRIPHVPNFFLTPQEAILQEQAPILETLPRRPVVKKISTQTRLV